MISDTTKTKTTRTTLATIKAFVRRNKSQMQIRVESKFDGGTDCVQQSDSPSFCKVIPTDDHKDHSLGITGAWFVLGSRDYFKPFAIDGMKGYEVFNCCGSFILAIKDPQAA